MCTYLFEKEKKKNIFDEITAFRGLTGGFLLLQNFSVAISVSPHVCFFLSFNFDFYVSNAFMS